MERLGNTTPNRGMHAGKLRAWGILFVLVGIIGRSVIQNQMLGVGILSTQELMALLQSSDTVMAAATAALVMQAMEMVALPIFVFLLVEGFKHTSGWQKYLVRVAGVALLSEIPYNLAMSQKVIDMGSRNPVVGLALCLVLLYLYQQFAGKKLLCLLMGLAGVLWCWMLRVDHGVAMVLVTSALWIMREKPMFAGFSGMAAAALCSGISPFYLAAPMGFMVTHFYNGEKGEDSRLMNYLFYPVSLLAVGLIAMFAM